MKMDVGMYPPLPKSYKNAYPFKIGTTSFIYPDHYLPNVQMLAPYLDEIELLLFESARGSLPSEHETKALARLAEQSDLTYNIHLPADISLADEDPAKRHLVVEAISRIITLTSRLSPSTYTLHLPYDQDSRKKEDVEKWQATISRSMDQLLSKATRVLPPRLLSIETLDYPFEWVEKIIADFDLSVCMDMGHLIKYEFDIHAVYDTHAERISIIHLHGVKDGQDHIALNKLSEKQMKTVTDILKGFTGVVSLEVFRYDHLIESLACLETKTHEVLKTS